MPKLSSTEALGIISTGLLSNDGADKKVRLLSLGPQCLLLAHDVDPVPAERNGTGVYSGTTCVTATRASAPSVGQASGVCIERRALPAVILSRSGVQPNEMHRISLTLTIVCDGSRIRSPDCMASYIDLATRSGSRSRIVRRHMRSYRSISPNTMSKEPISAEMSASMCFLPNGSSACSEANPGARILQR